jgi:hypothetical protein
MKTGHVLNDPKHQERQTTFNRQVQRKKVVCESTLAKATTVTIQGSQYLVDLGERETIRYHRVSKTKECSCGAPYCEAIEAVRQYLQAGGARAPDSPGTMPACPICGGKTYPDRNWDGKYTKEPGWRCEKGGLRHFLEAKAERIKQQLAQNPWLIPPAPGYPGVRRDELMTGEKCEAFNQKVFRGTGYDPTA